MSTVGELGSDMIQIFPGQGQGDVRAAQTGRLKATDVAVIAAQPYVDAVSPTVGAGRLIRAGSKSRNGQIQGVGEQYFRVQNLKIAKGRFFDADSVATAAQEAVIDDNTARVLF